MKRLFCSQDRIGCLYVAGCLLVIGLGLFAAGVQGMAWWRIAFGGC